jgi:TIR domain
MYSRTTPPGRSRRWIRASPAVASANAARVEHAGEDRERARLVADALTARGRVVWWDRLIHGGTLWGAEIERALAESWAVIVLWSEASVKSHFVLAEARRGGDRHVLIPARIEPCAPPMPFGEYHTIDLITWTGDANAEAIDQLQAALDHVQSIEQTSPQAPFTNRRPEPPPKRTTALSYASELFEFAIGPKTFLVKKWDDPCLGSDAATFYIISLVLQQLIGLPLALKLGSTLLWELLGGFIFSPIRVILLGAVIHFAWRIVGSTMRPTVTLSLFAYTYGLTGLLYTCAQNLSVGLLRAVDPALSDTILDSITKGNTLVTIQRAMTEYGLARSALFLTLAAWPLVVIPVICWGAYRVGNKFSRLQSAAAAAIAVLLGIPAYAASVLLTVVSVGPG